MAIDDVRLPINVERGASGGPGFKTTIITLSSGTEQRNIEWSRARGSWDIGYGISKREDLEEVYAFFMARRGRGRGFRFRDWIDFQAEAEPVGTGVSSTKRQLIKTYPDTAASYVREIVLPVEDSLIVYVDGIATEDYTLEAGGVLSFNSNPGSNVKATFEFDVPARFDIDNLTMQMNSYREGSIPTIPIVELRSA